MLSKFFCDITVFLYSIKGKSTKLNPNLITSIEITKDFFGNTVNKMEVTAMIPRKNIIEIIDNYQKTSVTLEILEIEKADDKVKSKNIYLKKTFDIIPADLDSGRYRVQEKTPNEEELLGEPMPFVFHLYNDDDINIMKKNVNMQLMSVTAADVLYAICHLRGIPAGNVIAQKPTLGKSNPVLKLDLDDMSNNLKQLNDSYGMYAGSPYAYKDYDYFYILDKYVGDPLISIPGEGTLISIHLRDTRVNSAKESGYNIDPKRLNDDVNFVGLPSISDVKNELTRIQNNNIIHVNSSTGVTTSKKMAETGGNKAKVIISNNVNILSKETRKMNALSRSMVLSFDNVPPSRFKPYKLFNFKKDPVYKDMDFSGNFKMTTIKIQLLKGSDSTLVPSVRINLINSR